MKIKFFLIIAMSVLLLTACQNGGDNAPPPSEGGTISEPISTPDNGEVEIDDKINADVVKVIQNYMQATHTKDEDLIRSTVLDEIGFEERAFSLWNDPKNLALKKLTYGSGDEKNEVVTVTFTNDEMLSFALTQTDNGWKIYDVD